MTRPADSLFTAGAFCAVELVAADIPRLQRFFDDNPAYFLAVSGERASPDEARDEIRGTPPEGWAFSRKWLVGFIDEAGALIGMANVVSDLLAPSVWHIGLFVLATRLHGSGMARTLYEALERWSLHQGARWMRLGVVEGNTRAKRFWERCAYVEVRKRAGVEMGARTNTLRVMAKPLAGASLSEYLALVARDRPER